MDRAWRNAILYDYCFMKTVLFPQSHTLQSVMKGIDRGLHSLLFSVRICSNWLTALDNGHSFEKELPIVTCFFSTWTVPIWCCCRKSFMHECLVFSRQCCRAYTVRYLSEGLCYYKTWTGDGGHVYLLSETTLEAACDSENLPTDKI